MTIPSASSLTRAMHCPASCVLPGVERSSSYSTKGDGVHQFLRLLDDIGKEAALAELDKDGEAYRLCETIDPADFPKGGHREVTFAWNVLTGEARILGHDLGREYLRAGKLPDEAVGTADYATQIGDLAIVADWKSGWMVGRTRDSWQAKSLGLFAARALGCSSSKVALVRVRDGQEPYWDIVTYDEFDLAKIASELLDLDQTIAALRERFGAGESLTVSEGDWCQFCPAWESCPAHTQLAREMITALDGVEETIASLSVADAARAFLALEKIDALSARIRQGLERYAATEPIALGDGRALCLQAGSAKDVITDEAAALKFIQDTYGREICLAAVGTSKSAITGAVKGWARENGKKLGAEADGAIDALRKLGIIEKRAGETKVRLVVVK